MSEADWAAMREKTSHVQETLADAMRRGVKPGSAEANELAEMAREAPGWFPGRPGFGRPGRGVLRPAGLRLGVWNWMWRSVLGHAMTL